MHGAVWMVASVLAGCAATPAPHPSDVPTPGASGGENSYSRIFFDDFSGNAGSGVNSSLWNQEVGGEGWGNSELQYYTDGTENTRLDGEGNLAITARAGGDGARCWYGDCAYTSGRINTSGKFSFTYGRVEARIKVAAGTGVWSAFWMLGQDLAEHPWPQAGEIDVLENVGRQPATAYGSLHGPGYSGGDAISASRTLPDGTPLSDDFHMYTVDWKPSQIVFSVDGVAFAERTPSSLDGKQWVYDHPFFLILNLAVGGNFAGDTNETTPSTATMLVDYVAVDQAVG